MNGEKNPLNSVGFNSNLVLIITAVVTLTGSLLGWTQELQQETVTVIGSVIVCIFSVIGLWGRWRAESKLSWKAPIKPPSNTVNLLIIVPLMSLMLSGCSPGLLKKAETPKQKLYVLTETYNIYGKIASDYVNQPGIDEGVKRGIKDVSARAVSILKTARKAIEENDAQTLNVSVALLDSVLKELQSYLYRKAIN